MRPTRCNNSDLLLNNSISTRFGHLYAHRQEIRHKTSQLMDNIIIVPKFSRCHSLSS